MELYLKDFFQKQKNIALNYKTALFKQNNNYYVYII